MRQSRLMPGKLTRTIAAIASTPDRLGGRDDEGTRTLRCVLDTHAPAAGPQMA